MSLEIVIGAKIALFALIHNYLANFEHKLQHISEKQISVKDVLYNIRTV